MLWITSSSSYGTNQFAQAICQMFTEVGMWSDKPLSTYFGTGCHAIAGTITTQEADAVNTLVAQVSPALSFIVIKKHGFDVILLVTALVKSDLKNLKTQTEILDTCLIAKAFASHLTVANALIPHNHQLFASTKTAYGV